jgi:hypothetical protein
LQHAIERIVLHARQMKQGMPGKLNKPRKKQSRGTNKTEKKKRSAKIKRERPPFRDTCALALLFVVRAWNASLSVQQTCKRRRQKIEECSTTKQDKTRQDTTRQDKDHTRQNKTTHFILHKNKKTKMTHAQTNSPLHILPFLTQPMTLPQKYTRWFPLSTHLLDFS